MKYIVAVKDYGIYEFKKKNHRTKFIKDIQKKFPNVSYATTDVR